MAEPCLEIHKDKNAVYEYTAKGNFVAVVSNGTAVLGLGNIGPEAAMPVMEGKSVLFKAFAGVDAFPICLDSADTEEIVRTVKLLEPTFGGVNLEDIAAPACFEIEARLKQELNIPVFHDDQHGTAIVTAAALLNALKVAGKDMGEVKVVVNGAGASAMAVSWLLLSMGVRDLVMCDTTGAIYKGRKERMNPYKEQIAECTNPQRLQGPLADAVKGRDVFIGLSVGNVLSRTWFAPWRRIPSSLPWPTPYRKSIRPGREAGARIIGTGRSDYPNQDQQCPGLPEVFRGRPGRPGPGNQRGDEDCRGARHCRSGERRRAVAGLHHPRPFDNRVAPAVAAAVARAAMESGVAAIQVDPEEIAARTRRLASI